jgi:hypothetical protein
MLCLPIAAQDYELFYSQDYLEHMNLLFTDHADTARYWRSWHRIVQPVIFVIFLLRQSDIGTDAGIVLMNGTKDCGLLRARGQRLDSVLFSQSDNRHITTSTWTVPSSFTASFPPHFTCFAL